MLEKEPRYVPDRYRSMFRFMVNPCYSKPGGVRREKGMFTRTSGAVILTYVNDFSDGILFQRLLTYQNNNTVWCSDWTLLISVIISYLGYHFFKGHLLKFKSL